MSKGVKTLIAVGTLLASVAIGLADTLTGVTPDITILYLIPIILATVYVGLAYGLFVSMVAAAAELIFHTQLGIETGLDLGLDVALHFLVFNLVALLIGRLIVQLRIIRELEEKRSYDLGIAKDVHKSVFVPFPPSYKNLTIASKVAFARELGGDYYHVATVGDKLFFCIADISGKSISAALFSAMLHQNITEALEHTGNLTELVARVNAHIYSALSENMFITLFCCLIDDNGISFVNAGHETPLLYSRQVGDIKRLESRMTLPIGIVPDLGIETKTEPFLAGDVLLAFTDGVTDSENFRDKPYERLEAALYANSDSNPQDIINIVYQRTISDNNDIPFDDIVITCIKRRD